MRFTYLGFIQHPHIKDAIITQVFTDSGKHISIVCGEGLYSSSKDGNKAECQRVEDAVSFEVLIEGEDDVRGWQSREDIDKLLAEHF